MFTFRWYLCGSRWLRQSSRISFKRFDAVFSLDIQILVEREMHNIQIFTTPQLKHAFSAHIFITGALFDWTTIFIYPPSAFNSCFSVWSQYTMFEDAYSCVCVCACVGLLLRRIYGMWDGYSHLCYYMFHIRMYFWSKCTHSYLFSVCRWYFGSLCEYGIAFYSRYVKQLYLYTII